MQRTPPHTPLPRCRFVNLACGQLHVPMRVYIPATALGKDISAAVPTRLLLLCRSGSCCCADPAPASVPTRLLLLCRPGSCCCADPAPAAVPTRLLLPLLTRLISHGRPCAVHFSRMSGRDNPRGAQVDVRLVAETPLGPRSSCLVASRLTPTLSERTLCSPESCLALRSLPPWALCCPLS